MLHHRLSRSKGPWNRSGSSLGHWKHGVNYPLPRLKRGHRRKSCLIRAAFPHRPLLQHGQGLLNSLLILQNSHGFCHRIGSALNAAKGPRHPQGNHNFMLDRRGLLNRPDDIPAHYFGAWRNRRHKLPSSLPIQGRNLYPSGEMIGACEAGNQLQRTLNSVIDHTDQSRPQFYGQRRPRGFHHCSGPQARGLLIHLDRSGVPCHGQHLSNEPLFPYPDHIRHVRLCKSRSHHQGPGNLHNLTIAHCSFSLLSVHGPCQRQSLCLVFLSAKILCQNVRPHSPFYRFCYLLHPDPQRPFFSGN